MSHDVIYNFGILSCILNIILCNGGLYIEHSIGLNIFYCYIQKD